ncbi:probable acyl-CoA dehydrogenase IBR3 isoform X2 [Tanacetum coccineum]
MVVILGGFGVIPLRIKVRNVYVLEMDCMWFRYGVRTLEIRGYGGDSRCEDDEDEEIHDVEQDSRANLVQAGKYAMDICMSSSSSERTTSYHFLIMGHSVWAAHVFYYGAPDTWNMEVLLRYGTKEQLQEWLIPLLNGTIRFGFAMTEPQVASSNATNIECSIKRHQSMILVDINNPDVTIVRPLTVFGFEDAPHGHAEISFENVHVPAKNILLGEGCCFEIAQITKQPLKVKYTATVSSQW